MGYKLNDKKENSVKNALKSFIALFLVFLLSQAIVRAMFTKNTTNMKEKL